jgi:hypothetical protein
MKEITWAIMVPMTSNTKNAKPITVSQLPVMSKSVSQEIKIKLIRACKNRRTTLRYMASGCIFQAVVYV